MSFSFLSSSYIISTEFSRFSPRNRKISTRRPSKWGYLSVAFYQRCKESRWRAQWKESTCYCVILIKRFSRSQTSIKRLKPTFTGETRICLDLNLRKPPLASRNGSRNHSRNWLWNNFPFNLLHPNTEFRFNSPQRFISFEKWLNMQICHSKKSLKIYCA